MKEIVFPLCCDGLHCTTVDICVQISYVSILFLLDVHLGVELTVGGTLKVVSSDCNILHCHQQWAWTPFSLTNTYNDLSFWL